MVNYVKMGFSSRQLLTEMDKDDVKLLNETLLGILHELKMHTAYFYILDGRLASRYPTSGELTKILEDMNTNTAPEQSAKE